jgi:hypothetical protein
MVTKDVRGVTVVEIFELEVVGVEVVAREDHLVQYLLFLVHPEEPILIILTLLSLLLDV